MSTVNLDTNFFMRENEAPYVLQSAMPGFAQRMKDFCALHGEEYNIHTPSVRIDRSEGFNKSMFLFFKPNETIMYDKHNSIAGITYCQYMGHTRAGFPQFRCLPFEFYRFDDNTKKIEQSVEHLKTTNYKTEEIFSLFYDDPSEEFFLNSPDYRFNESCVFVLKPEHYHYFHDYFPKNPTMFPNPFKDTFLPTLTL